MRYEKTAEAEALFLGCKGVSNPQEVKQLVAYFVERVYKVLNIAHESSLHYKTPLYEKLDLILQIVRQKDGTRFDTLCSEILKKSDKQGFLENVQQMVNCLQEVRALLKGELPEALHGMERSNAHVQTRFIEYLKGLERRLKDEKDITHLLYQKSLEDIRAIRRGERLEIQEQECYKLATKLQEGEEDLPVGHLAPKPF